MRIIRAKHFPPKGYKAITILWFVIARRDANMQCSDWHHEEIHLRQIKEMAYIPFYIWYATEYLVRLIQYKGNTRRAYRNISFEREAYANQGRYTYLDTRETFSFLRYLRKPKKQQAGSPAQNNNRQAAPHKTGPQ